MKYHRLFTGLVAVLAGSILLVSGARAQTYEKADLIDWPPFEDALKAGPESGKYILIDIFSPTCPWCRKMQAEVYTDPGLQSYLFETFELGRLDISVDDDTVHYRDYTLSSAQMGAGFGATGTPTTIFLAPGGEYITRLPGFHQIEEFVNVLQFIGTGAFKDGSFDDYLAAKGARPASSGKMTNASSDNQ